MKLYKLLVIILLFYTQSYIFSGGEEEFELETQENKVLVITKEGTVHSIEKDALKHSKTIADLMEDLEEGSSIPLYEITGYQFNLVRSYLRDPQKSVPDDIEQLITLVKLANYLAIEPLLGRSVEKLAEILPANLEKFSGRESLIEALGLPYEILSMIMQQENLTSNSDDINTLAVLANLDYYLDEKTSLDQAIKKLAEILIQSRNIEQFLNNKDWVKKMALPETIRSMIAQEILVLYHNSKKKF